MTTLNPPYVAALKEAIDSSPYFQLLGMKLTEMKVGLAVFDLISADDHLQPFGYVHGGAIASILDAAASWAVFGELGPNQWQTTVDLKINYLAPVTSGQRLKAVGRSIRVGRTLALARLEEEAAGRLVAFATATSMILEGAPPSFMAQLPPKFKS